MDDDVARGAAFLGSSIREGVEVLTESDAFMGVPLVRDVIDSAPFAPATDLTSVSPIFDAELLTGVVVVVLTVLVRVGEAGWAAATLALDDAVPCSNLDPELGTVVRVTVEAVLGTSVSLARLCRP